MEFCEAKHTQPAVENVRLELLLCLPKTACKPLHFVLVIRDEAIFMFIKQSTFLQMLHSRSGPCGNRTRLLSCLQGKWPPHAVPKPQNHIFDIISDTLAVYTGNDPVWIPAWQAGGHSMQPHRPIILSTPCWCRTNLSWASTMRCHWFSWRGRIKSVKSLSVLNRLFIFQGSFLHPTGACSVRLAGNAGLEPATFWLTVRRCHQLS